MPQTPQDRSEPQRSEAANDREKKEPTTLEEQTLPSQEKEESKKEHEYAAADAPQNVTAEESGRQEPISSQDPKGEPTHKKPETENPEEKTPTTPRVKTEEQEDPLADSAPKKRSLLDSKLGKVRTKGVPSLSNMNGGNQKESTAETEKTSTEDDEMILNANKPARQFNQAELWAAWDEYAAIIRDQDKQSYYSTLTKHKAILKDNFRVELLIDNHIQKTDLDDDRVNLLAFLREKLQNWRITLVGIIDEESRNDGDSLYDPQKKFEAMVDSNPTLAKLKQKFDLDVDYD